MAPLKRAALQGGRIVLTFICLGTQRYSLTSSNQNLLLTRIANLIYVKSRSVSYNLGRTWRCTTHWGETWNQSGASLSYSSLDVPHRAALQACWPITDVAITLRTCAPRNFKKAYAHSSA